MLPRRFPSRTAHASIPPNDWAFPADITNDGTVDFVDYAYLAAIYTDRDDQLPGDFDRDGDVDLADLRLLAEDWLKRTSYSKSICFTDDFEHGRDK
jgi:hypothetical protein